MSSRLSRKIVRAAFFGILTLELALFVPQYVQRERSQFVNLRENHGRLLVSQIQALQREQASFDETLASADHTPVLRLIERWFEVDALLAGVALYDGEGALIQQFEEPHELSDRWLEKDEANADLYRAQERFDLLIPSSKFQGNYQLVLRFSTSHIRAMMVEFSLKNLAQVIFVAGLVSVFLLGMLQKLLITPMTQFREDLTAAGQAAGQEDSPLFYTFYQTRKDELGEVAEAFCHMYHQIRHEIRDRRRAETALMTEQEKSERLLLNILPSAIAKRLKEDEGALASRFDEVTILFADIVGFTHLASQMKPLELLTQLNGMFSAFDQLAERFGLEKIKTIGDAYMIVGGIPTPRPDHAIAVLEMAIEMLAVIKDFQQPDGKPYQLRIGINSGPVIAGVIGRKKFSYDLWGDAVNIASRMESHGLVGHIQVTPSTYDLLKHLYDFEQRSGLEIKNVGTMDTYLFRKRKVVRTAQGETAMPEEAAVPRETGD